MSKMALKDLARAITIIQSVYWNKTFFCCIEYCADLILRASVDQKFSRQRKKRKFWVDDAHFFLHGHWISFSFREAWRLFMHCFWCSPQLCGVMTFAEKINKLRGWILEIYSLLKVGKYSEMGWQFFWKSIRISCSFLQFLLRYWQLFLWGSICGTISWDNNFSFFQPKKLP